MLVRAKPINSLRFMDCFGNVVVKAAPSHFNLSRTSMYEEQVKIIKQSLNDAREQKGNKALALRMFEIFFELLPEVADYFKDTDLDSFAELKFNTVAEFFVDMVESPGYAEDHVAFEVYRHISYDVHDKEYFFMLIESFKDVIVEALSVEGNVSDDIRTTWNDVATAMKSHIQAGAEQYL